MDKSGPAFPLPFYSPHTKIKANRSGMTLRDYFAAKALQGICANPDISKTAGEQGFFGKKLHKPFGKSAYALADAMLEAREEGL